MHENNCHKCLINTGVEKWTTLHIDQNFDHEMSLSNSKCWYSNNCLHFLKHAVPFRNSDVIIKSKEANHDVTIRQLEVRSWRHKYLLIFISWRHKNTFLINKLWHHKCTYWQKKLWLANCYVAFLSFDIIFELREQNLQKSKRTKMLQKNSNLYH